MSGYGGPDDHNANIEAVVLNGIDIARAMLPTGESNEYCDDCDAEIPHARRIAMKGCKYCVTCQENHDKRPKIRAVDWML